MNVFIPVAGTFNAIDDGDPSNLWWSKHHPWFAYMQQHGCTSVDPDDPFFWSTDLNRRAWVSGGLALIWYCLAKLARFDGQPLRIICHSFGISPVAYAAYFGLEIDTLISIGPPWRKDMERQYQALRYRTRRWLTIHAKEFDRLVVGGGFFDGEIHAYPPKFNADLADTIPGIGHSKILYEPNLYPLWETNGWLDLLTSETWGNRPPSVWLASSTTLRRSTCYLRSAAIFNARSIR